MHSGFRGRGQTSKRLRLLWTAVLLAVLVIIPVLPAAARGPRIQPINSPGFGAPENSYAWSMAWFKGKLYVGTSRHTSCVEWATVDYYLQDGSYNTNPGAGVTCPADRYDMDLRAEIWQYTPGQTHGGAWKRVYQAPADIPNPRAPGKYVARDIGYRGMAVYRDPDGHEALYVAGVTANEYIPEIAADHPPRILRSTNGETFAPILGDPGLIDTTIKEGRIIRGPMGFRSLIVNDGRLYVTASAVLTGDGVIMEIKDPWGPNPTFVQVSPWNMQVFEIESFNGSLYAGTGAYGGGYGVWKMNAAGTPPYQFTPIITDGAGRGQDITSVVSMHVFEDKLYVGASGWYSTDIPASELVRVNADDSWNLVVGNARSIPGGFKYPVSGLPDGFGNIFSSHFWRMEDHQNALYLGTNDWSWFIHFKRPILDVLFQFEYGYDVYGTCDGNYWFRGTRNAFGDGLYNFGARTIESTPAGAFVGSANHVQGTRVWQANRLPKCRPSHRIPEIDSAENPLPPAKLHADVLSCGSVLSWEAAAGAPRYRIQRAEYRSDQDLNIPTPLRSSHVGNDMPLLFPNRGEVKRVPSDASILGEFTEIGTSTETSFVDSSAKPGVRYAYQVVADYGQDALSGPSNVVVVPTEGSPATFDDVSTKIQNLAHQGNVDGGTAQSLQSKLNQAHTAVDNGDRASAAQTLQGLVQQMTQNAGQTITSSAANDLEIMLSRLERRTSVETAACEDTGEGDGESPSPSPSQPPATEKSLFENLWSLWVTKGVYSSTGRGR